MVKEYLGSLRAYVLARKRQFKAGGYIVLGVAVIGFVIMLFIYNYLSRQVVIKYTPVAACSLLAQDEAETLLGGKAIQRATEQTIEGNLASSKCSYTDMNANNFQIAAVAVRSAINDAGVATNKEQFTANRTANKTEKVTGIGDEAYYVPLNGQLHVLKDKQWLILSFGSASDTSSHTLDATKRLANKVIEYEILDTRGVTF